MAFTLTPAISGSLCGTIVHKDSLHSELCRMLAWGPFDKHAMQTMSDGVNTYC
jgi:hypothetical protein